MTHPWRRLPLSLTLVLVAALQVARADVKVTTTVTTRSGEDVGTPRTSQHTLVLYVQGDQARTESDDGHIVIYDFKGRHMYLLDAARQTYTVASMAETRDTGLSEKLQTRTTSKTRLNLTDLKEVKDIAGMQARKIGMVATIESTREPFGYTSGAGANSAGPGPLRQGSPLPALGLPMGAGANPSADPVEAETHDTRITGVYWVVDGSPLARNADVLRIIFAASLPRTEAAARLLDALTSQAAREGLGMPAASHIEVRVANENTSIDTWDKDTPGMVVTADVTSLEATPLDRMLFIVPANFRQTDR